MCIHTCWECALDDILVALHWGCIGVGLIKILMRPTPTDVAVPRLNNNCMEPTAKPSLVRILQRLPPRAFTEHVVDSNCIELEPKAEVFNALV